MNISIIRTRRLLLEAQGEKSSDTGGGLEGKEDRNVSVGSITQFREGHSSSFVVRPQVFQTSLLTPTPSPHK